MFTAILKCIFQVTILSSGKHHSPIMQINEIVQYVGRSFNSGTDFFFLRGSYNTQRSGNKAGQVAALCKCTCITGRRDLPAFALWKPLSERLSAVCFASHDGGESSAACVHQFLFRETGAETYEMLQAAFRESCLS